MVIPKLRMPNGDSYVARLASRHGQRPPRLFEVEIRAGGQGKNLAERGVGIGVRAAGGGARARKFGVAEADKGAGYAADHEDSMMPGPARRATAAAVPVRTKMPAAVGAADPERREC